MLQAYNLSNIAQNTLLNVTFIIQAALVKIVVVMPLKLSHHPSKRIVLAKLGSFCCRLICPSSADQCSTADYSANHLPKTICILS